ncbi:cyclic nucleotide-binding domain-containing protein [uncultured Dokdonia sp.]|uniref:Crp/Fnr family transcriptional regulator n=1 Tax=uncultured Dokdonia sp. TaxID=575653 RepID=UPI002624A1FE|nr:cyclic nucleotide-binding domain-containing protein [uncultured Dokdonia sp.]
MINFLRTTGRYSDLELQLLETEVQSRDVKKEEVLLEVGAVCSSVYFLEKGAVYQYQLDQENKQQIIELNTPQDWIINHQSFTSRKPSTYCIQAFEDSRIQELSIDSIHKLIAKSQTFLQMGSILEQAVARVQFLTINIRQMKNTNMSYITNQRSFKSFLKR